MRLFISYARADDEPFVKSLYEELENKGHYVWWDRQAMESRGNTFLQVIRDAIAGVDRMLLVVGPGAAESAYVRAEWEFALSICQVVTPILRLGDYALIPQPFKNLHAVDFRGQRPYPEAIKELLRILEDDTQKRGHLFAVPELPPHFLERPKELEAVRDKLLADVRRATVVTGTARKAGLQGMGGIGKTSLAIALARDCEVRQAFSDGILWITIGQSPQLLSLQSQIGEMLGDNPRNFTNLEDGKRRLSTLLVDKACLVVLDDIWETEQAAAFDALGDRCRMLITTRNVEPLRVMGIDEYTLGLLSLLQARELLSNWSGLPVGELPAEADAIAKECGYLPLGLAMIGAMVRGKPASRWNAVLQRLQNADIGKIKQDFPNYPYPDLLRSIEVSVEALEANTRQRYYDFAVFPDDVDIPEVVLHTWWAAQGIDELDTDDILDLLVDRSLLRRNEKGELRLHDLQVDYVRKRAGDLKALHESLLTAYNPDGKAWHEIPHDGYLYFRLAYHLKAAERGTELHTTLVGSPEWMRTKFKACVGDSAYVADLELAILDYADPLMPEQLIQLVQIYAARQVVHARVSRYSDAALRALVWLRRAGEALSHARLRREASEKFNGLLMVFGELLKGNQNKDYVLEDELLRVAGSIQDDSSRAAALSNLAGVLAQAGQTAEAQRVFGMAEQVAGSIQDDSSRADALSNLAGALAAQGHCGRALTLLGVREVEDFAGFLVSSMDGFKSLAPQDSVNLFRTVCASAFRILAWERPDWLETHDLLIK
jgi:tetratricopeptide (TPR) repeat protein